MSVWNTVKSLIKTIAPSIASVIGGPLAGNAVSALSNLLLGKDDATPEELESAIKKANPEQLLALKQLDLQFAQLDNDDRKNAREMYVSMAEKGKGFDWILFIFTFIIIWATSMLTGIVFFSQYVNDNFESKIIAFLCSMITAVFTLLCGNFRK